MSLNNALSMLNAFKSGAAVRMANVTDGCHQVGIRVVTSNGIPACLKYEGLSVPISEDKKGFVITRDPGALKRIAEAVIPRDLS